MKKILASTLILALSFSLVAVTQLVKEGKANPYPMPGIEITLKNPQNITYNDNIVPVVFTATEIHLRSGISFSYSLDNKERKPIVNITTVSEEMVPYNPPFYLKTISGNFLLFNLSEGWHKITVYCQTYDQSKTYSDEDTTDFFVDTIPILSFLSFENKTFVTSDVPLNFTVNQAFSEITYCLDGQGNVSIGGNTTLTSLPNGDHNVTVYATDEAGNAGASETIFFNVAKPEPPEPFLTTMVIVPIAAVTGIGIGLLVYFKKRKR